MESKKIEAFQVGDEIQSFFILRDVNVKTSSANKTYLDMTLADKTGSINGKYWNVDPEEIKSLSPGQLVKVRGTVTLWKTTLQFKIIKIRQTVEEDDVDLLEYVPAAPYKAQVMYDEIQTYIEDIGNKDIREIVKYIYNLYQEPLMTAPAAKSNHHAVRSGLLYHILGMLRSAKALCGVYPFLNKDLVYGGVLLHDIEKINEMDADNMGVVSQYTCEGQLLGHIVMGIKTIESAAQAVGAEKETALILEHMVLSHHYEPEYGSPKKPMFPEAEILHHIDMIDARMYDMKNAYRTMEEGSFSDPIFVLDRRRLYKPKDTKIEPER